MHLPHGTRKMELAALFTVALGAAASTALSLQQDTANGCERDFENTIYEVNLYYEKTRDACAEVFSGINLIGLLGATTWPTPAESQLICKCPQFVQLVSSIRFPTCERTVAGIPTTAAAYYGAWFHNCQPVTAAPTPTPTTKPTPTTTPTTSTDTPEAETATPTTSLPPPNESPETPPPTTSETVVPSSPSNPSTPTLTPSSTQAAAATPPPMANGLANEGEATSGSTQTIVILVAVVGVVIGCVALFLWRQRRRNALPKDIRTATTLAYPDSSDRTDALLGSPYNFYQDPVNDDGVSMLQDPVLLSQRIEIAGIAFRSRIHQSTAASIYRGRYMGYDVAIKRINSSSGVVIADIERLLDQAKFLSSLEHERILLFVGVAWTRVVSDVCVVTEFVERGDLGTVMTVCRIKQDGEPTPDTKIKIALQIAHALVYLHSLDPVVVHGQLNASKVLLDGMYNVKLTGIIGSLSLCANSSVPVSTVAPEVLTGESWDERADIYALGCLLRELHQGAAVVDSADENLSRQCLASSPNARPAASQVLYQLHRLMNRT